MQENNKALTTKWFLVKNYVINMLKHIMRREHAFNYQYILG